MEGWFWGRKRCQSIPLSGRGAILRVRGSWDTDGSLCLGTQLPLGAPQLWAGFKLGSPVLCWGAALWGQTTSGARRVGVQPPKKWTLLGGGMAVMDSAAFCVSPASLRSAPGPPCLSLPPLLTVAHSLLVLVE